jgi:glycerol-1-phosphate dehydrogenase [NAD(P)+]
LKSHDYLGRSFDCPCGRRHEVRPVELVYDDDFPSRTPDLAARALGRSRGSAAVLMDTRTGSVAGEAVLDAFLAAGWYARKIVVPDPAPSREPVCDEPTRDALLPEARDCEVIVPVGAGVLSDLGKYLAREGHRPQVTVATAASMNGYASANIAPTVHGVKTLLEGSPPHAVLAGPAVLREAPWPLTSAGLGDVLAKSVSSADWKLNHLLFGDYFCPTAVELIADLEPLYLDDPPALHAGDDRALAGLFDALILTGVAMTLAETSAPASGAEHLISHALDMQAHLTGGEHDLHGRQVGLGTVLASEVYARVLAVDSPDLRNPPDAIDRSLWGHLADEVASQFAAKRPRLESARQQLADPGVWDRLRTDLASFLRPPEHIRDALASAGAATTAEDLGTTPEFLKTLLRNAHEIRSRFTVFDLAHLLGILPDQADGIVERLAADSAWGA